jgi:probable selenate reductase FAD-binding subunit
MILEYHRPDNLEEALRLLSRETPRTLPMGGGTVITNKRDEDVAVVDIQNLGLDYLTQDGSQLHLGAMLRLQTLAESKVVPLPMKQAIHNEYSSNLRKMATVAGEIVACDGRSVFATALLAMDARLTWMPDSLEVSLGNFLPLRHSSFPGKLIQEVIIPSQGELLIEKVARSPVDLAIIAVGVYRWPSGRMRVAVGGYGTAPVLIVDGPDGTGAEEALLNAYHHADDEWASGEYRSQVAAQLTRKMVGSVSKG